MTFLQVAHDRPQVIAETILPIRFVDSLDHAPILQEMLPNINAAASGSSVKKEVGVDHGQRMPFDIVFPGLQIRQNFPGRENFCSLMAT